MLQTVLAALIFAVIYGIAIRSYVYLRTQREPHRWHFSAMTLAGLIGGVAFYAAQQIKNPHALTWRDAVAFIIMAVAASAVPAILELVHVVRARVLRNAKLQVPPAPPDSP